MIEANYMSTVASAGACGSWYSLRVVQPVPVKPVVAAGQVERARQLVFAFTGSQTEACSQAATQIIQVRCQPCPLIVVVKDEQRGNNDIPPTLGTNKRLLPSEPGEISFIHHDSCAMYTINRWLFG